MYKIIRDVIENNEYKLEDMLHKISKMYIEDRINENEKSELDNLARSKAKAENSYDMQKQIDDLRARVEALESKEEIEEAPTEEYPEYIQPTGAHDSYKNGDKVTYNGKKYICLMDGCAWSPETYPQAWQEVIETTEDVVED